MPDDILKPVMIEREARLFEAGSYPDKGVDFTEADLDVIAANTADAPVKIEHTNTPFDGALGLLKSACRRGKELFGKVEFTEAAWALIDAAKAKRVSVAITKAKDRITELSLVRNPRIEGAAVFSGDVIELNTGEVPIEEFSILEFMRSLPALLIRSGKTEGGDNMPEEKNQDATFTKDDVQKMIADALEKKDTEFAEREKSKDARIANLESDLRGKSVDATIDTMKRAGKLAPAAETFAREILLADKGDVIEFSGAKESVSSMLVKLLETNKATNFSEQGKVEGEADTVTFSDDLIEATMKVRGETREKAIEALKKQAEREGKAVS